jgi:hypothetical protein
MTDYGADDIEACFLQDKASRWYVDATIQLS